MRFADVVTTCVQPQIRIPVFIAVFLAVVEHTVQHVPNGAVVTAAIAGGEHDHVLAPRNLSSPRPSSDACWDLEVPLWLDFEVSRLWRDIRVSSGRKSAICRCVVAIVFERQVAEQPI